MRKLALVSSLLFALSFPVAAQDRAGTLELSPFGGAYLGGRLEAGSNAIFNRSVDVGDAGTFGVRLGYNFNRRFGLEWSWAHARADIRDVGSSTLFGSSAKVGELTVDEYEMNGVVNMGKGRVIPYFTIGAGATTFKATAPGVSSSTDTRFAANMGFGLKLYFDPRIALRIEGRGRRAYVSSNSCDSTWNDGCRHDRSTDSQWYTSGEVTGGLSIAF